MAEREPTHEELMQQGMAAFREVQARMGLRLAPGETMQVCLPGGAFLTIYAAPSGMRPVVQVTLPVSNDYSLLVERREPAPGQQECGFIRMFER
jgi:hypothetical protein